MYYVEKTKGFEYQKQFDYILFTAVLLLTAIGIIALSSAVKTIPGGDKMLVKQVVSVIIGITAALVINMIDYKDFKTIGFILYYGSIVLLVLVLFIGTGKEKWGSNSWLILPVIGSFQPSETAKITFIMTIAVFFERLKESMDVKNIVKLAFYSMLPIGLILLQPDAGTAIVFMCMFGAIIYIIGLPYKYIFGSIMAFIISTPFLWFFILQPHQKNRIYGLLFPDSDKQGATYQINKAIEAIGSGKLFGKGLYRGLQTQSTTGVPVKESDFIFTVIGEEMGFIGGVLVILLVMLILFRCLYIARNSRDLYGSYLVIGYTAMYAFHFFQNIGMNIGILPITGIPLPFISYGGTAMITNFIAIGIIMSVSARRKKTIFNPASN